MFDHWIGAKEIGFFLSYQQGELFFPPLCLELFKFSEFFGKVPFTPLCSL